MKVSKAVKEQKEAFVREMFVKDIATRTSQVQHELKVKFGNGLTSSSVVGIRHAVAGERSQGAATTAAGLKATGARTRVKPPAKEPSTPGSPATNALMMQRQIEDLAGIIRKRIPGIRKFVLLIGDDGKPSVEYNVVASLEGKLNL